MAVDVCTEVVIERSRDEVAGYATDPSNAPEWYANIDSVEWRTPVRRANDKDLAAIKRILERHQRPRIASTER